MKPDHITQEQYDQWNAKVEADPLIPPIFKTNPDAREVCIAGYWLQELLDKQLCPHEIKFRIFFSYGEMAYEEDPWKLVEQISKEYANGTLVFADDDLDKIIREDKLNLN
jgi:hypothetical protein